MIDTVVVESLPAGMRYRSFWIGCSDDACLESGWPTEIRSETVIHTSLANQMPHADLGILAALDWAISMHDIERIVICGHYRCKVIEAAAKGDTGEIVEHWLSPLKKILAQHQEWLATLSADQRLDAVCELNALYQAFNTSKSAAIKAAWEQNREISLTAVVNDMSTGRFRDLNFMLTAGSDASMEFGAALDILKARWIGLTENRSPEKGH